MTDTAVATRPTILRCGDARVVITPERGGRITSLRVAGDELLAQGADRESFPMVPWCGRTRGGSFQHNGLTHRLPLNDGPHAIHGTGRDGRWDIIGSSPTHIVLSHWFTAPWPFHGRAVQRISLREGGLDLRLTVHSEGEEFPAQAGWHPWFIRRLGDDAPAAVTFDPAWQEERGDDHTPTGRRIEALPGPWDDCFAMPDGVQVDITWPGRLSLRISSDAPWVVVYDEDLDGICIEPQSGPPNGLNTAPAVVSPNRPLTVRSSWTWSSPQV